MSTLWFVLGCIVGGGFGFAATKAWHHQMLADGFTHLANVSRDRAVVDQDVIDAFGSGRVTR